MRNTLLSAVATAALLASGSTALAQNVQVVAQVELVCEILDLPATIIDFGTTETDGNLPAQTINFNVRCNDVDGANVSLSSQSGGLAPDDDTNSGTPDDPGNDIEYIATLDIDGTVIELDTLLVVEGDPAEETGVLPGSAGLAEAAGVPASLTVDPRSNSGSLFASGYSDTIEIRLTAIAGGTV